MNDTTHGDENDSDGPNNNERNSHESDSDESDSDEIARAVFAGLAPTQVLVTESDTTRQRIAKSLYATVPIVLVGSMAVSMSIPIVMESTAAKRPAQPKAENSERVLATAPRTAASSNAASSNAASAIALSRAAPRSVQDVAAAPRVYRVVSGDTVTDVAATFGLSVPTVLALNGLSWSSLIFPGQELLLSATAMSADSQAETSEGTDSRASSVGAYTIVSGDTISAIAERFGVSTISVLMANGLGWSSIIYPGQTLIVPGSGAPNDSPVAPQPDSPTVVRDESAAESNRAADQNIGWPPNTSTTVEEPPAAPSAATPTPVPPSQPAPSPESQAPAPTAPLNGSYTIVSGDTLSGIAARFGISTQALLDANGLSWSSVIYGGQNLIIPGVITPSPGSPSGPISVDGLTVEMAGHVRTIIQVGRELGVPEYGIVIALATAMQESSLRNLNWGDRDSVGLFQQRPSSGWGSVEQLTTPAHAARLFYGGPSNPNRGYTRGLLDISGWASMSLTQAAQAVQISGHPDAYAKWEQSARSWYGQLG